MRNSRKEMVTAAKAKFCPVNFESKDKPKAHKELKMKLKKILLFIVIFFISKFLTAQINIPGDSIATILCHKWGFKAILIG